MVALSLLSEVTTISLLKVLSTPKFICGQVLLDTFKNLVNKYNKK